MAGKKKKDSPEGRRVIAQNRKARHNYFINDVMEAGIVLTGTEVKSLRAGRGSINESYAGDIGGEIYLINAYIPEYTEAGAHLQHKVRRPRKLLLHKREMNRLLGQVQRKGITLVPLSIYFNPRNLVKVEIGIAEGKQLHDKRETAKKRDWQREKARVMRDKG